MFPSAPFLILKHHFPLITFRSLGLGTSSQVLFLINAVYSFFIASVQRESERASRHDVGSFSSCDVATLAPSCCSCIRNSPGFLVRSERLGSGWHSRSSVTSSDSPSVCSCRSRLYLV